MLDGLHPSATFGRTYLFFSGSCFVFTVASLCLSSLVRLGRQSVSLPDADPPQLVQILKVLSSQFLDSPCSAVAVVVLWCCKRKSLTVEEAPESVVGVHVDFRTLLAVGNGPGEVLRLYGEGLATAKTSATKS